MEINIEESKIVLAALGEVRLGRLKGVQIPVEKAADLFSKVYDYVYVKPLPASKQAGNTKRPKGRPRKQ